MKTHPRIPLSRYALEWRWRWSYTATLVPTRWIFISRSFLSKDLKHSQVDAEIEVVEGNEKEQDSKEAETEVPQYKGALSHSDILPRTASFRFDVSSESICQSKMKTNCEKSVKIEIEDKL